MTTCWHPEHRLAFIHIPKCAGTSIGGWYNKRGSVWADCWLNEVLPGWTRHGLPNGHQPVKMLQHFTGKPLDFWDQILVTIRNPFEQQLSQYTFWRNRGLETAAKGKPYHNDDRFACSMSFEAFVQDPRSNGPNAMCGEHWRDVGGVYRWWCVDQNGQIPPNVSVIRVEDLADGALDRVLEPYGARGKPIPVTNTVDKPRLEEAYTAAAEAAVRAKFAWAFACHYPGLTLHAPQEALV